MSGFFELMRTPEWRPAYKKHVRTWIEDDPYSHFDVPTYTLSGNEVKFCARHTGQSDQWYVLNKDPECEMSCVVIKEYVLVYAKPWYLAKESKDVLIVVKDKPDWQKGRINLLGGSIDPGESVIEAAERELLEESGLVAQDGVTEVLGTMEGVDWKVHCCLCHVDNSKVLAPRPEETQQIDWRHFDDLMDDPALIPNLRVIIPLMRLGVNNWAITDQDCSNDSGDFHSFKIKVPTWRNVQ